LADLHTTSTTQPDRLSSGPAPSRSAADRLRDEIAALDDLDFAALRARWRQLYRNPAPPKFRRALLIRGLAYQMQVKALGDLSPKTCRKLLKIAAEAEGGGFTSVNTPRRLRPGTRLVRAWKGVTHTVNVLDVGFEWQGARYGSLSAIAREISGTSWNGNTFFGLGRRRKAEASDA
jgi:hypothetical protein